MEGRTLEAEKLLRHALSVLDFIEDEQQREHLATAVRVALSEALIETDRYAEAEPLIRRLRELAQAATDPPRRIPLEVRRNPHRLQGNLHVLLDCSRC